MNFIIKKQFILLYSINKFHNNFLLKLWAQKIIHYVKLQSSEYLVECKVNIPSKRIFLTNLYSLTNFFLLLKPRRFNFFFVKKRTMLFCVNKSIFVFKKSKELYYKNFSSLIFLITLNKKSLIWVNFLKFLLHKNRFKLVETTYILDIIR